MAALFSGNSKGIIFRLAHKINRNSHFSVVKFSTKREVSPDLFPKFFKSLRIADFYGRTYNNRKAKIRAKDS